jgi:hypothetical protein
MDPKMKFESRTGMAWFASGKMTFGASRPSTSGTGGSGGACRGVIPRSNEPTVGGDTGGRRDATGVGEDGAGAGADWQAAMTPRIASRVIRMQGRM